MLLSSLLCAAMAFPLTACEWEARWETRPLTVFSSWALERNCVSWLEKPTDVIEEDTSLMFYYTAKMREKHQLENYARQVYARLAADFYVLARYLGIHSQIDYSVYRYCYAPVRTWEECAFSTTVGDPDYSPESYAESCTIEYSPGMLGEYAEEYGGYQFVSDVYSIRFDWYIAEDENGYHKIGIHFGAMSGTPNERYLLDEAGMQKWEEHLS